MVARTSAFKFKGRNDDLRDVGRRLGVSTVLEGDVRAARGRLRITARLISTRDGFPIWSETYEREMNDIFLVQEQIARAIVMTLRPQFENVSNRRFSTEYSHSVEAYRTYLKGRYLQHKWSGDGLLESLGYFQTALHLDPGFAPALVELAESYLMLGNFNFMPQAEAIPKARKALQKALELDADSALLILRCQAFIGATIGTGKKAKGNSSAPLL